MFCPQISQLNKSINERSFARADWLGPHVRKMHSRKLDSCPRPVEIDVSPAAEPHPLVNALNLPVPPPYPFTFELPTTGAQAGPASPFNAPQGYAYVPPHYPLIPEHLSAFQYPFAEPQEIPFYLADAPQAAAAPNLPVAPEHLNFPPFLQGDVVPEPPLLANAEVLALPFDEYQLAFVPSSDEHQVVPASPFNEYQDIHYPDSGDLTPTPEYPAPCPDFSFADIAAFQLVGKALAQRFDAEELMNVICNNHYLDTVIDELIATNSPAATIAPITFESVDANHFDAGELLVTFEGGPPGLIEISKSDYDFLYHL